MMENKLLPCPFCGGEAKLSICLGRKAIVCTLCECLMIGQPTFSKEEGITEKQHLVRAWNRRAAPANPPLTLEQLREMDGEPVWMTDKGGNCGIWALVTVHENAFVATAAYGTIRHYSDYGKTWLAYAHKPEQEDV